MNMSKQLHPYTAFTMAACLVLASPLFAQEYVEGLDHWPVLTLQRALQRGLSENLDLRVQALNVPIGKEDVTAEDARFDPAVGSAVSAQTQRTPTPSSFSGGDFALQLSPNDATLEQFYEGEAGINKKFRGGLDGSFNFRTYSAANDAIVAGLDPQYRSYLVLDLTQPLLRDFGSAVNTADLRIAENRLRQATFGTLNRTQRLAADIETAYYEMALSIQVYGYRIESRDLAQQLLAGNREKFEAGLIPISEVQEAETAVASRDELVLAARQQVETAGNRLKDLLEINRNDPMSREFFRTESLPGTDQSFPAMDEAMPLALTHRPELEQQRIEIASRNIRLEYTKNQTLPRLDLAATLGVNGLSGDEQGLGLGGVDAGSNPWQGDYFDSVNRLADGDGYEWAVGIRFSYPLGNREAKARHRRSGLEKKQAIYGLKRLETTVETEVIDGLIAVNRNLERVKVAGRFESLAETTLNQEMERLQEGLSDTFRILTFQDKVIEASIRRVNALGGFNKGLAGLYRAMGTNLKRLNIVTNAQSSEIINATN